MQVLVELSEIWPEAGEEIASELEKRKSIDWWIIYKIWNLCLFGGAERNLGDLVKGVPKHMTGEAKEAVERVVADQILVVDPHTGSKVFRGIREHIVFRSGSNSMKILEQIKINDNLRKAVTNGEAIVRGKVIEIDPILKSTLNSILEKQVRNGLLMGFDIRPNKDMVVEDGMCGAIVTYRFRCPITRTELEDYEIPISQINEVFGSNNTRQIHCPKCLKKHYFFLNGKITD